MVLFPVEGSSRKEVDSVVAVEGSSRREVDVSVCVKVKNSGR